MKNLGAENIWQESGALTAKVLKRLGCGRWTGERPIGVIELVHPREDQLIWEIKAAFA